MKHKFNAIKTERAGFKFDSKKEARYFDVLRAKQRQGDILFFLRQVPFHLPGNVKYVVDFVEFHADDTVHFVDVKGFKTALYKAKKKLVESLYPIIIEEV